MRREFKVSNVVVCERVAETQLNIEFCKTAVNNHTNNYTVGMTVGMTINIATAAAASVANHPANREDGNNAKSVVEVEYKKLLSFESGEERDLFVELLEACNLANGRAYRLFMSLDADGNGLLSAEEVRSALQAIHAQAQASKNNNLSVPSACAQWSSGAAGLPLPASLLGSDESITVERFILLYAQLLAPPTNTRQRSMAEANSSNSRESMIEPPADEQQLLKLVTAQLHCARCTDCCATEWLTLHHGYVCFALCNSCVCVL